MTTKTVDEWCAEQVGRHSINIEDANDREIVREHFRIATEPYDDDDYRSSTYIEGDEGADEFVYGDSKSIAEAEKACIQVIYEASQ